MQSGNRVEAEKWFRYADHYQRVLNEMQANRNGPSDGDDQQNDGRRGRGRRDNNRRRPPRENDGSADVGNNSVDKASASDEQAAVPEVKTTVDPEKAPQPTEVHPELELGSAEEKPKRKAPVRRRRTVKPKEEDVKTETPKGDEAA